MSERSSTRTLPSSLWSALAGGAVGLTLGLLLAPRKGVQTRRRVAYQLESLALRVTESLQRIAREDAASEAQRTRAALASDAQARADHIREDIDALLEELRKKQPSPPND
ncbi:YtxH domain-containing protein [Salisaeta longa]|uniref:YtxH domain-containing protein n=1 Tax=Salisaeta longa TaxID=503170 RepID=UPI0003B64E65|nr:YtxH domain-containing protein [Salisaeta longa]